MEYYNDRSGIYWLTFTKEGADKVYYYIGQTCQLNLRRRQHEALFNACCSHNAWINSLKLDGYQMTFNEFMPCDADTLHKEERNAIAIFIETHGECNVVNKQLYCPKSKKQYYNPNYYRNSTLYRNNVGFTGFSDDELDTYLGTEGDD